MESESESSIYETSAATSSDTSAEDEEIHSLESKEHIDHIEPYNVWKLVIIHREMSGGHSLHACGRCGECGGLYINKSMSQGIGPLIIDKFSTF